MAVRTVVNVATAEHTLRGQVRLSDALDQFAPYVLKNFWHTLPPTWPPHTDKPYAFKAYALEYVGRGFDTLLWCDACILPIRSLEPVWAKIERDGYLLMRNGFTNYEWTADSAYPDLFADEFKRGVPEFLDDARERNRAISHTVGGFFGLSMKHENGRAFLAELYRLASETRAFCGPWINTAGLRPDEAPRYGNCGPCDVLGHRHDQTAMSVIAWRLDMKLTDCPEYFAYGKAQDARDKRTAVVADGAY